MIGRGAIWTIATVGAAATRLWPASFGTDAVPGYDCKQSGNVTLYHCQPIDQSTTSRPAHQKKPDDDLKDVPDMLRIAAMTVDSSLWTNSTSSLPGAKAKVQKALDILTAASRRK